MLAGWNNEGSDDLRNESVKVFTFLYPIESATATQVN